MSTFYLLPARANLETALGELLGRLLPGLPLPAGAWDEVAERLAYRAGWPGHVYLIPRDDLPDGEPLAEALATSFGAEPGDRVVEVSARAEPRLWTVGAGPCPLRSGRDRMVLARSSPHSWNVGTQPR